MTPAARVVSLVPSVTETLSAWGRPPIACTRFCERDDLPHVGGTKDPDVGAVVALDPDLVVVDAEENRREDADALVSAGLRVHALRIRSIDDLDEQLPALADAVGVPAPPRIGPAPAATTVSVVVPIWRRPWMVLGPGTYGADVLARCGRRVVAPEEGEYVACEPEELAGLEPSEVVAPDEPYPFGERHRGELAAIAPVRFVDGRDLFWWGARTEAAIDRLGALLGRPGAARAG